LWTIDYGLEFTFNVGESLFIGWIQDEEGGDPFRIGVTVTPSGPGVTSEASTDMMAEVAARELVGWSVLEYRSRRPGTDWHGVPWGVELVFGNEHLLIVASSVRSCVEHGVCSDSIVCTLSKRWRDHLTFHLSKERHDWRQMR
jgi:hypothetical protein